MSERPTSQTAIIKGLIENLNLWAEEYSGKPISLSLFRAATILTELELYRGEVQKKYDKLAVENMLDINKICNQRDAAIKELKEAWLAMDEIEGTDRMNEWQNKNAHFLNIDT